jgi:hypothetical protein
LILSLFLIFSFVLLITFINSMISPYLGMSTTAIKVIFNLLLLIIHAFQRVLSLPLMIILLFLLWNSTSEVVLGLSVLFTLIIVYRILGGFIMLLDRILLLINPSAKSL